jgi:hypothetical protein
MKRRWVWIAVAAMLIVLPTVAAARPTGSHLRRLVPGRAILDYRFPGARPTGRAASPAGVTSFQATVKDGTKKFTYVMVGKNPAKKLTNPATVITTYLVPVSVVLSNADTFDPTVTDACDALSPAITRVAQSPMFVPRAYKWGGTAVGKVQYIDAFRRAEFWKYTKRKGINPGYHVNLTPTTLDPVTVNVPDAAAAEGGAGPCGEALAGIEISWWDDYVHNTLLPSLVADGVGPSTLPIFVFRNVVLFDTIPNNCCILGYHSAVDTGSGIQTYGISDYDTGQFFTGVDDASVLAHEVGEWMDDPLGSNPTKRWGHIGQVTGCQGNLEVGDPLSGTELKAKTSGYAYHVQELAFFSWFYHQKPSLGVNGWYSNGGTFKKAATVCH